MGPVVLDIRNERGNGDHRHECETDEKIGHHPGDLSKWIRLLLLGRLDVCRSIPTTIQH
jgi:hypothetical protein